MSDFELPRDPDVDPDGWIRERVRQAERRRELRRGVLELGSIALGLLAFWAFVGLKLAGVL